VNINLLARALGRGVEAAAVVPYLEWRRRLESLDSISEVVKDSGGDQFATFDLMPIQELNSEGQPEIEVRILASDGTSQLTAYFYARPKPEAAV
jgi:hypothetical protein